MTTKICECGCNQEFEVEFPNCKVIPEHRYEHRLRLARESMRRIAEKKKAGGYVAIPRRAQKVDSVCPYCEKHHKSDTKHDFCPSHTYLRAADSGNENYMSW